MFNPFRRKRDNPYTGLRRQILRTVPAEVGITPSPELPRVWGLMMDATSGNGGYSLVLLADGTTSLDITADSIIVANDAQHPLTAPEVVLAVDGSGAGITLEDGATIRSTGTLTRARTGDYVIDGKTGDMTGQGAVVRVNAVDRLPWP